MTTFTPNFTPLLSSERDALCAGGIRLESLQMTLSPRSSGALRNYAGPGYVEVTTEGKIELRLFHVTREPPRRIVFAVPRAGTLITDEHLYNLEFVDFRGRRWTSTHVLPDTRESDVQPGAIVTAELQQLVCTDDTAASAASLWLHFPGGSRIPANTVTTTVSTSSQGRSVSSAMDTWDFEHANTRYYLVHRDECLEVTSLSPAGPLPCGLDTRLEETLWFVTGKPLRWNLMARQDAGGSTVIIRPAVDPGPAPRVGAPLELYLVGAAKAASQLFLSYLTHISSYSKERYHPLSVDVDRILRAGQSAIEYEALALSVSVESVLHREFEDLTLEDPDTRSGFADLRSWVERWSGSGQVKDRALGALSQIAGKSATTALRRLEAQGTISRVHREAWDRIRHTAAHGRPLPESVPQLLADCALVHQLFLFLVFKAIKYSGPFTDRATPGWPQAHFPLNRDPRGEPA